MTRTATLELSIRRETLAFLMCALVSIPLIASIATASGKPAGVRQAYQLLDAKPSKALFRAAQIR